ncbi:hypothetical protein LQ327_09005 [Actinomycetospora endophytica]|uniref:Phage tail-like protein n=1 Tax=Actinomycetospora endophytica TaxID=2291215 RepID=A0ABS8P7J6_9PSEU|nr:hypothetical protein [Actinomycetospora endophytica]MCD2193520.1 hypothetical protein [Actinomycetospora endophytica]
MSTEQMYLTTVHIDDPAFGDLGVWDKRTGGDTQIAATKHRPGGMGPEKTYRSLPTYSDITVTRVIEPDRGDYELFRRLKSAAGRVYGTVTEQPLDDDGHPQGDPSSWYGRLANCKPGQTDSNGTAIRSMEVDFHVETIT